MDKATELLGYKHRKGKVETEHLDHYWTYVSCPTRRHTAHLDRIVIAVKGICRGNGQHNPRGAIGVFFHEDNHQNISQELKNA